MSTRHSPPGSNLPEPGLLNRRYRIGRRLGKGGMGAVYECRDTRLADHVVAIKENSNTSAAAQEQFQREANILARLHHPNLPKVTDYFIEPDGRQYLVMDYVPGEDLEHIIRRDGALGETEALRCMAQMLSAVHYLHTRRDKLSGQPQAVIHRDIKPSNIKRTADGQYILVDFGISKLGGGASTGTLGSIRALTPGFAPIEQYDGGTDERSDIYSLGATLYVLLTLHIPPSATERARKGSGLTLPRKYNSQVSARTEQAIERAMKVEPDARFQAAADMYKALLGRSISSEPPPGQPSRRQAAWLALAAVLIAAAVFLFSQFANLGTVVQTGSSPAALAPAGILTSAAPEPTATEPAATEPAATEPAATEPAATEPTATEPAAPEPAVPEPAVPEPTVPEPAAAEPAATEPAATEPASPDAATDVTASGATGGAASTGAPSEVGLAAPAPQATGRTIKPTSTALPTATPTAAPLPTVTLAPSKTPAAAGTEGGGPTEVTILSPPDGTRSTAPLLFRWEANAPLAEGQVFEVAFWRPGEGPDAGRAWRAATAASEMMIDPAGQSGSYRWGIWLAHFDAQSAYQRLRYLGPGYTFDAYGQADEQADEAWGDSPLK